MKIKVVREDITKIKYDLIIVNIFEGVKIPGGATGAIDKFLNGLITELIANGEISGKIESFSIIHTQGKIPSKRVAIIGLGKKEEFDTDTIRKVGATVVKAAKSIKAKNVATILHGGGIGGIKIRDAGQALVEGAISKNYSFREFITVNDDSFQIENLIIVENDINKIELIKKASHFGETIANAVNKIRNLVNSPSNYATPALLAQRAQQISTKLNLNLNVIGLNEAKKLGMGAFYAVAKGSKEPAKIVIMSYKSTVKSKETIALIGKGITFDSGGISLKPSRKLEEMKNDMAGAATIIESMDVIAQFKPNVNVMAVCPLTENMPSGEAQKPGDIIKSLSGKTIEVISTDAEGRLILADAITYAKQKGATKIVDIATLTGGCVTALGDVAAGVMGNDDKFSDSLIKHSRKCGEKMWVLPMFNEYEDYLKSDIADIKNCMDNGKASPITGAIFLKKFVEDIPWIHIDIAGTAYLNSDRGYNVKGATGFGLKTIVSYVCDL
jgi:leucyl aminopeptidase